MTKMMLIDAVHPEEVRVAVVDRGQVEDFDFESAKKKQLRGNIYLAKITRVEPSLQAAFVDYGGNRHGFLAFSEIHPDYYQLPQSDREALIAESSGSDADVPDVDDVDEDDEERSRPSSSSYKKYKIQEVIRRRQIMLVQAVKEERGTKGAALTTYLSLAGRYCVLMPNTPRGGGISRKITNASDRKRLKKIVAELNVPEGMGLIVRTAGAKRTKTEIKRDFEYLIRLWSKIRELTLSSVAPCLINEEAGLVHRALRDLYDKDIDRVIVDGEPAYREAKDLAKMLMPSHAKKVQLHKSGAPVFADNGVETQLDNIFSPVVNLRSGGYLVIHQTEALVAIDVNSGKSTRERNIEQTALRTNLEAAEEACRQMRLRDLAGLVVIDFIDMEESKNNRSVERRMKDCLKYDRARVQYNKISMFGLMEISRQRRRAGVLDSSSDPCTHCNGTGHVRSVESSALQLLRAIENRSVGLDGGKIEVQAPTDIILFLLNEKRQNLSDLEMRQHLSVQVSARNDMLNGEFDIRVENAEGKLLEEPKAAPVSYERSERTYDRSEESSDDSERSSSRRKRRRSSSRSDKSDDNLSVLDDPQDNDEESGPVNLVDDSKDEDASSKKRRRRGRRGGRRRRKDSLPTPVELNEDSVTEDGGAVLDAATSNVVSLLGEDVSVSAVPIKPEPAIEAEADSKEEKTADAPDGIEVVDLDVTPDDEFSSTLQVHDITEEQTPAPTADIVANDDAPSGDATDSEATHEPVEVAQDESPAPEPEADVEEPEALPETEKPKKIRRGWWQKRSAG
jgi:ribonuclease E